MLIYVTSVGSTARTGAIIEEGMTIELRETFSACGKNYEY